MHNFKANSGLVYVARDTKTQQVCNSELSKAFHGKKTQTAAYSMQREQIYKQGTTYLLHRLTSQKLSKAIRIRFAAF